MRAVLTKVKHASVTIDGELKGKIGRGFLILLGVAPDDTEEKCRKMADKLCSLRRLAQIEGDYTVYPGHMNSTTLAREKAMNPYLHHALR